MKDPKDYFSYDYETGVITRIKWDTKVGNPVCDYVGKDGYVYISFNNGKLKGHRLAWYLYYGEYPKHDIDHINHNKADNRISNLRDVPTNINCQNSFMQSNNKSGYTGVKWHKQHRKWMATIGGTSNRITIGVFKNYDDAVKARKEYERKLGYHTNHGRRSIAV